MERLRRAWRVWRTLHGRRRTIQLSSAFDREGSCVAVRQMLL